MAKKKTEAEQAGILVWGRIGVIIAEAATPLLLVRLLDMPEVGGVAALMLLYTTAATVLTAGFPPALLYFLADRSAAERRGTMKIFNSAMVGAGAYLIYYWTIGKGQELLVYRAEQLF